MMLSSSFAHDGRNLAEFRPDFYDVPVRLANAKTR